jgi:hypothetical protein
MVTINYAGESQEDYLLDEEGYKLVAEQLQKQEQQQEQPTSQVIKKTIPKKKTKIGKAKIPSILKPKLVMSPAPRLTQEQGILHGMFGGGSGTILGGRGGYGLPKLNFTLTPGRLGNDETADMFGFGNKLRRRR